MNYFKTKGESMFVYEDRELHLYHKDFTDEWMDCFAKRKIYHMFKGEEFLNEVKKGLIMSSDGSIADVFVDGYQCNLGLFTQTFQDGHFLVDEATFETLCKEHEILVNWANK